MAFLLKNIKKLYSVVRYLLDGYLVPNKLDTSLVEYNVVNNKEGFKTYEIQTQDIKKDEDKKIQVVAIGPVNKKPIKSVLLLGETGAGKTCVITTMINHLLGVRFEDDFRYQLKDKRLNDNNLKVESQTEYITAYIVYHQLYDCNYILIDTPGFGDTREDHERVTIERLTAFLTTNYGIDDLNCVALVAKANQNRISKYEIQMLKEFTSVLGSDIGGITQLLATFASDESPAVIDVVRHAQVHFVSCYQLDNWPLCVLNNGDPESSEYISFKHRWTKMEKEYGNFFEDLQNSNPVSLERTRELLKERKCLEETKVIIISNIKNIVELENECSQYAKINSIEKKIESLKKMEMVPFSPNFGQHVHNCDDCKQTCVKKCVNPDDCGGVIGATAAAASVAVAVAQTGTSPGTLAKVGTEVGAIVGPAGAAVGFGVGLLLGFTIGAVVCLSGAKTAKHFVRKLEVKCPANFRETCKHPGCNHKMEDHTIDTNYIWEERIPRHHEDEYNELLDTLDQLKTEVNNNQNTLDNLHKEMNDLGKRLLKHNNKINELCLGHQSTDSIINQMISDEGENYQHIQLLCSLKKNI